LSLEGGRIQGPTVTPLPTPGELRDLGTHSHPHTQPLAGRIGLPRSSHSLPTADSGILGPWKVAGSRDLRSPHSQPLAARIWAPRVTTLPSPGELRDPGTPDHPHTVPLVGGGVPGPGQPRAQHRLAPERPVLVDAAHGPRPGPRGLAHRTARGGDTPLPGPQIPE
jgi:hypothetical protein